MPTNHNKRIFGLDLMRAAAISFVVFSHILWIAPETSGVIKDLMKLGGVMGVEIFFVLSGFLIGRIIYRMFSSDDFSKRKLWYFWIRRWFRTLPNYYLVLVLNVTLCIYLNRELPNELWQYFFFVHNFAWEMPWLFPESWSLSIEEFAYILGPLLLYLGILSFPKKDTSKLFLMGTIGIILVFILTKIIYDWRVSQATMTYWNTHLKAVVIYRLDAIYYGFLAAYLSLKFESGWNKFKYMSLLLGAILFLGLNYLIPAKQLYIEQHSFFWNVLYLPINSIAIAFSLPWLSTWKKAPKLLSVPITFVSVVSYSVYLLHYSIVMQLMKYYLPSESLPTFDLIIYVLVYLTITLLASYLLYKLFEKPLMNLRNSHWIRERFDA